MPAATVEVVAVRFADDQPDDRRQPDKNLAAKLRAEADGILAWAARGALAWQQRGLGTPAEVQAAAAEWRTDMDTVTTFIEELCLVDPHQDVPSGLLYAVYVKWAEDRREDVLSARQFRDRIKARGFVYVRDGNPKVGRFKGIRIHPGSRETA